MYIYKQTYTSPHKVFTLPTPTILEHIIMVPLGEIWNFLNGMYFRKGPGNFNMAFPLHFVGQDMWYTRAHFLYYRSHHKFYTFPAYVHVHILYTYSAIQMYYSTVHHMYILYTLFFVLLFYVGTHLARCYSSRDPQNRYNAHTYSYTQHNHQQSQTIKSNYTHTLCGQWQHFFVKSFRGAGLGLNPKHPITLAHHHH